MERLVEECELDCPEEKQIQVVHRSSFFLPRSYIEVHYAFSSFCVRLMENFVCLDIHNYELALKSGDDVVEKKTWKNC